MPGIPPANSTDAEDVAWGLQTAEALWNRGERIDALVWLRRAAQAAGDVNDDDRALELARFAAELSDWMASAESDSTRPRELRGSEVDVVGRPAQAAQDQVTAVNDEVATALPSDTDRPARVPSAPPHTMAPAGDDEEDDYVQVSEEEIELSDEPSTPSLPPDHEPSVLPAERVHAGMFNPWEDAPREPVEATSIAPDELDEATPPDGVRVESFEVAVAPAPLPSGAELVTSVPPEPAAEPPTASAPPRPSETSRAAPPIPSRPKPPVPSSVSVRAAPPVPPPVPSAPASVSVASAPAAEPIAESVSKSAAAEQASRAPATPVDAPALDLESVDAFADLPDDAREAFAAAAKIDDLAEGEEVQKFALAYVVSGTFDVAATMVDAAALRVDTGAVLRARGSLGEGVPMRLVCAGPQGRVASWSDAAVEAAFRTIPWVEEDLRAAADRVQTLVGITVGPLGERLDASIRDAIVERLELRAFTPGERVVEVGQQVPGIVLVGIGDLEIIKEDDVLDTVGSGEFLFPGEVLGGGDAPNSVRAGRLGAIALVGDRKLAQELLVTCPPLLEVFAGM